MKIISFAWTVPALLAGRKTCTRREWKDSYARRFKKGDLVAAYDKSARYGGKQVAVIQLTQDPYMENTREMPDADFEAEGIQYMAERGLFIQGMTPREFWLAWKAGAMPVWVIRFKKVADDP